MTLILYFAKYPSLSLWYVQRKENTLQGFLDSDYAGNLDDRTSTSAYLFTNGSTPVSWSSKKKTLLLDPLVNLSIELLPSAHVRPFGCVGYKKNWDFALLNL